LIQSLGNFIFARASAEIKGERFRFHGSAPSLCLHEVDGDSTLIMKKCPALMERIAS
jgi:hypothetical protein